MFTSFERSCAEKKLKGLYERMGFTVDPVVVWCQSPWQLIMMPALLPIVLSETARENNILNRAFSSPMLRRKNVANAKKLNELLSPYNQKLWDQLWIRLESTRDFMRWNGRNCKLGSAYIPDESELEGICNSFFRSSVESLLGADLSERVSSGYHERDSRMNGTQMRTQFFKAVYSIYGEELSQYLLSLYQDNRMCRQDAKALCETFFHTNLQFLVENIQFVSLGNQGCAAIFFQDICFVMERPLHMHSDSFGRLHNEDGVAMVFADGYDIYAVEGTLVYPDMIEAPNWLTVERIYDERNQEIRRIMLKRYGIDKFIRDSQAELFAEDEFGQLYRKDVPNEPMLVFVRVVNSSPEPDGSFREYFIRVPPEMRSPREAVAWTFGLKGSEYAPLQET